MNIEIIDKNLQLDIYGFAGIAINQDYTGKAFQLMDKMWQVVKSNNLPNKGKNIWVYEDGHKVFAGVEMEITPQQKLLEHKTVSLQRHAYYKHIGSYKLIKQAGQNVIAELKNKGLEIISPYIEIYGHWTNDESKLETELFFCLK